MKWFNAAFNLKQSHEPQKSPKPESKESLRKHISTLICTKSAIPHCDPNVLSSLLKFCNSVLNVNKRCDCNLRVQLAFRFLKRQRTFSRYDPIPSLKETVFPDSWIRPAHWFAHTCRGKGLRGLDTVTRGWAFSGTNTNLKRGRVTKYVRAHRDVRTYLALENVWE